LAVGASAKVLVIDDEAIVGLSCQAILGAEGCDVRTAITGEEALSRLQTEHFDVVLLDLKIPGSGGLNLLPEIRKVSPRTEVVVITGYPSLENAKELIRLGAFEYVAKPFVPLALRNVIQKAILCKPWAIHERC
jgi:DNA-binding NtrC family response regulator